MATPKPLEMIRDCIVAGGVRYRRGLPQSPTGWSRVMCSVKFNRGTWRPLGHSKSEAGTRSFDRLDASVGRTARRILLKTLQRFSTAMVF